MLVSRTLVSRLRERQYQLAAQKHNEAFRKYDYYQQTARYFERECRIAKHYDSWNFKDIDPKKELEKAKKAEKLLARRKRLRTLFKEEEEIYRRELEGLATRRNRAKELSLDDLREKLRQKKAEESLYLPRTCRRYQSYFANPKQYTVRYCNTLKDTNLHYSRDSKDSTNYYGRNGRYSVRNSLNMSTEQNQYSKGQENFELQQDNSRSPSPQYIDDGKHFNSKFSARYSRRSLENTNVRGNEPEEYVPSQSANAEDTSGSENMADNHLDHSKQADDESVNHSTNQTNGDSYRHDNESPEITKDFRDSDDVDKCHQKEVEDDRVLTATDNREFESEKSLPWLRMDPTDKNLSKQMFLYLHHKELKTQIEDLLRRETHACMKHCWDEALRLRDMRNRLELVREKRLYHTENLDLDEDVKKIAMATILQREKELAGREDACTDSTMYSEDAKALWKKWVHEDETSVIEDARAQREALMNSLEKEWQNLAIRDKDTISRSFENDMMSSTLQDEHKLTAAMKSHSSPTE